MNVRALAFRILRKYESEKFISREDVDDVLSVLEDRDRRFLKELVWGVIRKEELLDWYIDQLLKKRDIPPAVRVALRMGAYQLLFMDSVPDYAAVNETVKLLENENFKKLVNAVLRRIKDVPPPKEPHLLYSHPAWIIEYWSSFLPWESVQRIMVWNQKPLPVTLRANTLVVDREELLKTLEGEGTKARPCEHSPIGVVVEKAGIPLQQSRAIKEGLVTVQGEPSQLVPLLFELRPGLKVLDACSSPGGKTTEIAELMKNEGDILAVDVSFEKVKKVQENCQRLGIKIVRTLVADAERLSQFLNEEFDRILLDVPCSALGTARSHPEVLRRVKPKLFEEYSEKQLRMLFEAWKLLKEGGYLIYSTCTVTHEENRDVLERFSREVPSVEFMDIREKMEMFKVEGIWDGFGFLMLPDETITPFYVSLLKKIG